MADSLESVALPVYIGFTFGCLLFGISLGQALFYYRSYGEDRAWLKLLVTSVLILELAHTFFLVHFAYENIVLAHNNPAKAVGLPWSFVAATGMTYLTTFVTQSFYAFRVWFTSGHNKIITGIILLLALFQTASGIGAVAGAANGDIYIIHTPLVMNFAIAEKVASIICDSLIAAAMAYFLSRMRTGFQRMESIIKKLVFYSITLGLWTSIVVLIELVLFVGQPSSWSFLVLHLIITKCHANSLLAFLNARIGIRKVGGQIHTDMTLTAQ